MIVLGYFQPSLRDSRKVSVGHVVWPSLDWPDRSKDRPLLTRLRRKARAEFAGGEGIQGAEAGGKLDVGQAALAVERPEKIRGGEIAFVDVACLTAGNEIAAGVVAELCTWDDMIEAAGCGGKAAQAIKTAAAFSGMNGPAQPRGFQEVEILEVEGASTASGAAGNLAWASGANLTGEAYLDHVTRLAAFHEAQDTLRDEAAHRPANGVVGETRTTSEPEDGELEPKLSFETAMADEMRVDHAVGGGQT